MGCGIYGHIIIRCVFACVGLFLLMCILLILMLIDRIFGFGIDAFLEKSAECIFYASLLLLLVVCCDGAVYVLSNLPCWLSATNP